ncbi:hypothetical protein Tco_0055678 [Tanacetum coccineum]
MPRCTTQVVTRGTTNDWVSVSEEWFRRPRGRVSLVDRGILAAVNDEVPGTGSEPMIGIKGGSRRLHVEFSLAERGGYYSC